MGLYGSFETMTVRELLAWIGSGRKSGTLEVELDEIVKRIVFRMGRVVACSSNQPATLMGQFLLSQGKISRETLREALTHQKSCADNLGAVLKTMGAITDADRDAFVEAKIEETIYGLFDWDSAVFRFFGDALPDPNAIEVELEIPAILERGTLRANERRRSQRLIGEASLVLGRTGEPQPPELSESRAARRVFELIDGVKTVAEIQLHSHAPEFLVMKLLTALLEAGVVEIQGKRARPAVAPTVAELEVVAEPPAIADVPEPHGIPAVTEPSVGLDSPIEFEPSIGVDIPAAPEPPHVGDAPATSETLDITETEGEAEPEETDAIDAAVAKLDLSPLVREINVASQLLSAGQTEAALDLLNAMARAHPGDPSVRDLLGRAEQEYCRVMRSGDLHPTSIPTAVAPSAPGPENDLSPEEAFLLSAMDGRTDIQALLWISPMREVEALRALSRMARKGRIEFLQAA